MCFSTCVQTSLVIILSGQKLHLQVPSQYINVHFCIMGQWHYIGAWGDRGHSYTKTGVHFLKNVTVLCMSVLKESFPLSIVMFLVIKNFCDS